MGIFARPVSKRRFVKGRKLAPKKVRRLGTTSSITAPYNSGTRGNNPKNSTVFRGIGFPDKLTTNLVYTQSLVLSPTALLPTPYNAYKASSLYDPEDALGGGQPTYFDQLATIYGRYMVNGCKITAMFSLPTQIAANIGPYLCGIQCSDGNALPTTNSSILISSNNTSWKLVSQDDGTQAVTATYSPKNAFQFFDDNLQARTNNDPVTNWYFKVFASPQGVAVTTPINVVIIMEFNATFSTLVGKVDS